MRHSLKATMMTVLLSSVAVAPIATISILASADAAYAKSDKSGGKGGGNSKASEKSSGKNKTTASRGGGSDKKGGDGLNRLLDKITGKDKKKTKAVSSAPATGAAKKAEKQMAKAEPKARPEKGPMHPSNLGNMNGALNANINAVLAHIRNGNTNGPVGAMAMLAVAKSEAAEGQSTLDLQQDFLDLEAELAAAGYDSVTAYYAALDGKDPIEPIPAIEDALTDLDAARTSEATLASELEALGFTGDTALADYRKSVDDGITTPNINVDTAIANYQDPALAEDALAAALAGAMYDGETPLTDYESDKAGTPPAAEVEKLNTAITTLDGNIETRTDVQKTEPTADDLIAAAEKVAGEGEAEDQILTLWNKSGTAPEETGDQLLTALHEKLDANADAIASAIDATMPDEADPLTDDPITEEDVVECDTDDASCETEDDLALVD